MTQSKKIYRYWHHLSYGYALAPFEENLWKYSEGGWREISEAEYQARFA